jgi:hypothetical protein
MIKVILIGKITINGLGINTFVTRNRFRYSFIHNVDQFSY